MSAVNLVYIYLDMVGIYLHSAIVKGYSVSRSNIALFRYRWIHLQAAIVQEDSVRRQSSISLFGYRWIHLQPAIV